MFAKFGQDSLDLPNKNACIPDIMSVSKIALCSNQIGFFNETLSTKSSMSMSFAYLVSKADIAIARLWRSWLNTDSDKIAFFCQIVGQAKRLSKGLDLGNHVICTEDSHYAFWIFTSNGGSGPGDSGCRIAAHRFEQDLFDRNGRKMFPHQ